MTHFEAEYAIPKVVRCPTMKSIVYHQANMLQNQVFTEMRDVKSSVDRAIAQINTTSYPFNPD